MGLSKVSVASRGLLRPLSTLCALCALLAAGCTTINLTAPVVPTQPTVPGGYQLDTSGTVTVGVGSLPTNFNPAVPAGDNPVTQMVMEQVWPQPFVTNTTFDVQTTGLLVSAEVEGISPFRVVYRINPRAVWSDGVPISAADFIYDWQERLRTSADLATSGLIAGYRDVVSVLGTDDDRTVTVTFRRPFSEWQSLFANLVPAHIGERYGWSKGFAGFSSSRVISGGPFEVSSYRPGRSLTLTRNPRYWGTPAHVKHIRFVLEPTQKAMLAALASGKVALGEVDASRYPPGQVGDGIVGAPTVVSQGARSSLARGATGPLDRLSWSGFAGDEIWQLCFNVAAGLTSELALRRAVEYSLNRSEIVEDSEDLVYSTVGASLSRFTLGGESANPTSPGTTPLSEHAPVIYHPSDALALFRQLGYTPGREGLLRVGGIGTVLRLSLVEPTGNWAVDQAGLVIQAELQSAGVLVDIVKRPLDTMLSTTLPHGDYELALAPFSTSTSVAAVAPEYSDPVLPRGPEPGGRGTGIGGLTSVTEPWSTSGPVGTEPGAVAAGGVTRDVLGMVDPGVAAHLNAAIEELNPPAALADLQQADSRMWNQAYSVPLFQPEEYLVRSRRVDNVSESPTWAGIMWDAQDWAIVTGPKKGTVASTTAP